MTHHFTDRLQALETQLAQEQAKGPITGMADLQERMALRLTMDATISDLEAHLADRRRQLAHLPRLPLIQQVRWAQAVLACPNLAFLEVDTTGLGQDAYIIRVLVLDREARVLFDTFIHPPRPLSAQILQLTGIQQDEVDAAPTLAEAWPSILAALLGRYLLAFNLAFDLEQLIRNAEREQLDPPILIAECLMQRWMAYADARLYPKLAVPCQQIGSPLPTHPRQTAYHRACGRRALMQAMASGFVDSRSPARPLEETTLTPTTTDAIVTFEVEDLPF
jgi:Exonuclease